MGLARELLRGLHVHKCCELAYLARREGEEPRVIMQAISQYASQAWPEGLDDGQGITKQSTCMGIQLYLAKNLIRYRPEQLLIVEDQISFTVNKSLYICNVDLGVLEGSFDVKDIKTSKASASDRYRDFWQFHPQLIGYAIAAQQVVKDHPVVSYTIDAIHMQVLKKGNKIECQEYTFLMNPRLEKLWWNETEQRIRDIKEIREGKRLPCMNKSCCFEYGKKCAYFSLCQEGVNAKTLGRFEEKRWDPVEREMMEI